MYKKQIIAAIIAATFSQNLSAICACSSQINQTLDSLSSYIIEDNLNKIKESLKQLNTEKDKNLEQLEKEKEALIVLIESENKEVVYLQQLVFQAEQEKQLKTQINLQKEKILYDIP